MKVLINSALIIFGVVSALVATEGLFRLCGASAGVVPVSYNPSSFAVRPPYVENALTGWQLKSGTYNPLLGDCGRAVKVSIRSDASRATREDNGVSLQTAPKIVFIGDSFTFGEGLDDEETLPWRLQESLPDRNVINHGVGGYGTCQAMLRLSQLQPSLSDGDIVVYGLSAFHEERSTADPRQDYWVALSSPNYQSGYPRCSLKGDEVVREDSKEWTPLMPLTGLSVISRLVTDARLRALAAESLKNKRELTYALIAKMRDISTARGATLIVLLQDVPPDAKEDYRRFLVRSGISYLDGTEITQRQDLKLPDGHPGPQMTQQWANQLRTFLSKA